MLDPAQDRLRRRLTRANRGIRADRPMLPDNQQAFVRKYPTWSGSPREATVMYQFWFRTRGCTFDRAGQCSMCNYGIAPEVDQDTVADAVRRRLAKVPMGSFIYLSPSGSLLDDREVPAGLRERLLGYVADRRPGWFAFETRPELCDPAKLDWIRRLLPATHLICQIGVESWNPVVRNLCHLKPTPQSAYLTAVDQLQARGFEVIANVTLGGLGLSYREAYQDTLASVRGTRAAGFSTQMVFPLSAKSGTLLGWAHDQGCWEPPSLWMLVRLLVEALGDDAGDVDVSWFDPSIDRVVRTRPDGCARCRPTLIAGFEAVRLEPRPESLDRVLDWDGCDCPAESDRGLLPSADRGRFEERLARIAELWETARPVTASGVPVLLDSR